MGVVLTETADAVRVLTLNRPDRLNAVSEELYRSLLTHLRAADTDPAIRAVVLAGSGRAFCAGADMKAHNAGTRTRADRARYVELAWQACYQIQRMDTPVVAAVHGYAIGAGAEIAVSADFLLMAEDAVMGFPEISIGTYVGGGVTKRLPRLVGARRAAELLMLGERFTGGQAQEWGLARSIPGQALRAESRALAGALAAKAPISLAKMKAALRSADSLELVLHTEAADLLEIMDTQDWAEGVAAFAQRRQPVFQGR